MTETPVLKTIREYEFCLNNSETISGERFRRRLSAMEEMNAWDYESKIKTILGNLKIYDYQAKIKVLSGGQKNGLH